ncbi:hypothetical protein [Streptomyces sp. NPDC053079]|uniref:hypothetical protein n=1 Tax=Streptomyces sp. NPDC053079 TaxID=3365697 RepID=UPI0037CE060C
MSSEPLQISVDQLRHAFDVALRHIEASVGHTVSLKEDCFWSVPGDELYNVHTEPQALAIGQPFGFMATP